MAKSVKIEAELFRRIAEHAEASGYSSPEEFVTHLIERELAQADEASQDAEQRLRGLGYLE